MRESEQYESQLLTTSKEFIDIEMGQPVLRLPPQPPLQTESPPKTDYTKITQDNDDIDLSSVHSILSKIKTEWLLYWRRRTGVQRCKKSNHIMTNLQGVMPLGLCLLL
jgi:hypothetical protein